MKKGLLSILASALLVVGCQNYDDQFNSIENSINALNQQIDGLSAVSSQLASLSATVQSLSTTVSSLPSSSEIATQISDGLAGIIEDVADLEAAVAAADSSEALTAIQEDIDAQEDVLAELLANSSVFSGDILINSVATLDAYHAMGSGLSIVNGSVTFDVSTDMDAAKVQEVADQMLTITKDFSYTGASATTVPTFKNLTGVQSLTMEAPGDYRFDNLVTAAKIVLNNDNASKIGIVHFGALENYTQINTDGALAGVVSLPNTTEFHFTSVERLASDKLDITLKKGSVLALSALTGLDADGDVTTVDLDISGPANFTSTKVADGTINLSNVATVDISGFYGAITIGTGVDTLKTSKAVSLSIAAADDLTTATIDVALDWDPALTTAAAATTAPTVTFASQDLTTASVTGVAGTITAIAQNNLTSLTVKSTGKGNLVLQNNTDLETLVVTGSTLNDITITGNNNLTSLVLDHTTGAQVATDLGATVNISTNTDLESLTFSADKVDDLTVTGNTDLTTVDFEGLALVGGATANVNITANNLSASVATDDYQDADGDGTAEAGDGETTEEGTSTDKGSYTTESGLSTLSTYLKAAVLVPGTSGVIVAFDEIGTSIDEAKESANNSENTSVTVTQSLANAEQDWYVAYVTQATVDTTPTVRETFSWFIDLGENALYQTSAMLSGESLNIDAGVIAVDFAYTASTLDSVDELITAINAETAFGTGVTVTAVKDAASTAYYDVDLMSGGTATNTKAVLATHKFAWSFGTTTGTHTISAAASGGLTATLLASEIAGAINDEVVSGVKYSASASSGIVTVSKLVTNTANVDKGSNTTAFPAFAIDTADTTNTTVVFAQGTATNAAVGTSGTTTYTLVYNKYETNGLRVTVKNNSTVVSLGATASVTITDGSGSAGLFRFPFATALASGTNMPANANVQSPFDNNSTPAADVAGENTNRISWLG